VALVAPERLAARVRSVWAKHSVMRMLRVTAIAIVIMNVSLVPELFRTRARYSGASREKHVRPWR
jgi:hypothetical protein